MISNSTYIGSGRERSLQSLPLFFPLLAALVFAAVTFSPYHYWDEYYYLYSVSFFSLPDLLNLEPGLGQGLFPQAFFSAKIGFVFFLDLLSSFTGQGYSALILIQSIFALIVLLFAGVSWLLLRELLDKKNAQYAALVLLFLPVTMYFSYKILSELFGLIFTVIGCLAYLRGLRSDKVSVLFGYGLFAVVFLLAGVLCRFTSVVFFGGMVLGLFVLGDSRYPLVRNFLYAAVVTISLVASTILFYSVVLGLDTAQLVGLVRAVQAKSPGLAMRVYAVGMFVQLFFLPILFVFRKALHPHVRFGLLWTLICTLPFVLLSKFVEPRYFYMGLVPFAILVHYGLLQFMASFCTGRKGRVCWLALLAVIVLGNRLFFFSLMPYELDQNQYTRLKEVTTERFPGATYLVPWVSDYSFLRFAYPEDDFKLVWSPPGLQSYDFFASPSFISWVGGDTRYMGSRESFTQLSETPLYIGWRYNQPVIRLKRKVEWLQSRYAKNVEMKGKLKNHLALSWVWVDPAIRLEPVVTVEPYEAFLVRNAALGNDGSETSR